MARPSFKLNFFGDYIFHLGKNKPFLKLFCFVLVPNGLSKNGLVVRWLFCFRCFFVFVLFAGCFLLLLELLLVVFFVFSLLFVVLLFSRCCCFLVCWFAVFVVVVGWTIRGIARIQYNGEASSEPPKEKSKILSVGQAIGFLRGGW